MISHRLINECPRSLRSSLENLITVFGNNNGLSTWTDGCDPNDSHEATIKNCWRLSKEQFHDYAWHAVITDSQNEKIQAVKYFLPRVAADLCLEGDSVWSIGYFASLMQCVNWRAWPDLETEGISTWTKSWLEYENDKNPFSPASDSVLIAGVLELNLKDYFYEYRSRDLKSGALWLAHQINYHWNCILTTGWPSGWKGFWEENSHVNETEAIRFVLLLIEDESIGFLQSQFFESDEKNQTLYSDAVERAEFCRNHKNANEDTPLYKALAELA